MEQNIVRQTFLPLCRRRYYHELLSAELYADIKFYKTFV